MLVSVPMSLPSDLYRSLDGFFHRQVDRVGQVLDRKGVDRSLAASICALSAAITPAFAVLGPVYYPFALISSAEIVNASADMVLGPNTVRSGAKTIIRNPARWFADELFRSIRTVPATIAVGYAAHGIATLAEGATRGVLEPEGVRSLAAASAFAAPAISSYLRERDPPAPEEDPMRAYVPKRLEPLERIIDP